MRTELNGPIYLFLRGLYGREGFFIEAQPNVIDIPVLTMIKVAARANFTV